MLRTWEPGFSGLIGCDVPFLGPLRPPSLKEDSETNRKSTSRMFQCVCVCVCVCTHNIVIELKPSYVQYIYIYMCLNMCVCVCS